MDKVWAKIYSHFHFRGITLKQVWADFIQILGCKGLEHTAKRVTRAKDTSTDQAKNIYLLDAHRYRQPYLEHLHLAIFKTFFSIYLCIFLSFFVLRYCYILITVQGPGTKERQKSRLSSWLADRFFYRFSKNSVFKCFLSTRKRKVHVFKLTRFEELRFSKSSGFVRAKCERLA